MSREVMPTLQMLFGASRRTPQTVHFEWRLIRRRSKPFLLVPTSWTIQRGGWGLYSPQRWSAKFGWTLLPLLFRTPVARMFERIDLDVDINSEFLQFLYRQSGVPPDRIQASAIRFSGALGVSRITLLICDKDQRPVSVAKVGLNSVGRELTACEADLIETLPDSLCQTKVTGRLNTSALTAFATAYLSGGGIRDDVGLERLFQSWLNPGPLKPLASLETWRQLEAKVADAEPGAWRILHAQLAGKVVRTTLYHGDFASWNVRVIGDGDFTVFDWERGQLQGIPGWDWFHFVVQTGILVKRHSPERVAATLERLLRSERMKEYMAAAAIGDIARPLLLAFLLHQKWVINPTEGARETRELLGLLSARWQVIVDQTSRAAET